MCSKYPAPVLELVDISALEALAGRRQSSSLCGGTAMTHKPKSPSECKLDWAKHLKPYGKRLAAKGRRRDGRLLVKFWPDFGKGR